MESSSREAPCGLEVLATGKHLRLVRRGGWEFVERPGITGIAILVALTNDGQIVLIEQYREPVGALVIELPAGLAGDEAEGAHEPLAAAALRELQEETGFAAGAIEELFSGPPSAGLSSEILTFFLATDLTRTGSGGGVAGEAITVHTVPLGSAVSWLMQKQSEGRLIDPKVLAGLLFAEVKCNS